MLRAILLSSLFLTLPLAATATAQTLDNTPIDRSDVPGAVWTTVRSVAPTAAFTEFGVEREDGRAIYELGLIDPDGLHLEIDVLADGTLQEIEWETRLSDVQTPVHVEFRLNHPGAAMRYVERSIRPNGDTVYEIEGVDANGKPIDFEIMDNGRRLMVLNRTDDAAG